MTLKWLSSYAPVDEEFDNVSLLLHGDGTNGSTTIVDSSSRFKAVTVVGDAQISTAQSKFGGSSIAFDGSGDELTSQSSSENNFGTDDWTIEFWILSTQTTRVDPFGWNYSYQNPGWASLILNLNGSSMSWYENVNQRINATNTGWNNGSWNHVAITRSGNSVRMFLNGTQVGLTYTTSFSYGANPSGFIVGNVSDKTGGQGPLDGYIDDLRITKGVARYTSNFTPPTAPFPDLSPSGRVTIEDNSLDVDARQYIINVEEQDGQPLESGVRTAINDFVVGCKSDGIWNAIKASCILAGARTLDGALVPLTGGAPTNFNFVGADYDRETGLVGDGSTKYLDSNRAGNADPQNNQHCSIYVSTAAPGSGSGQGYIGAGDIGGGTTNIVPWAGGPGLYMRSQSNAAQNVGSVSANGFIGLSRSTNNGYSSRVSNTTSNQSVSSQTPNSLSFTVFSLGSAYYADGRLSFYSIGESLDLALLDTHVSNLMTAIGAAIP
jgi:hypothetical protein